MIGGYEHRAAQLEMAELVHDAFTSKHHAVVEAGTGTGKTLAYLLPAICSGRRVVISTATKSLQEQLYQKDIPFLQKQIRLELDKLLERFQIEYHNYLVASGQSDPVALLKSAA